MTGRIVIALGGNACLREAGAARRNSELQAQRLFELGNVRESRNCRPIRNDADADNDSKGNQQCVTRRPAVLLVFIDIRHDVDLPPKPGLRLARFAVRAPRRPLSAFNSVLSVLSKTGTPAKKGSDWAVGAGLRTINLYLHLLMRRQYTVARSTNVYFSSFHERILHDHCSDFGI